MRLPTQVRWVTHSEDRWTTYLWQRNKKKGQQGQLESRGGDWSWKDRFGDSLSNREVEGWTYHPASFALLAKFKPHKIKYTFRGIGREQLTELGSFFSQEKNRSSKNSFHTSRPSEVGNRCKVPMLQAPTKYRLESCELQLFRDIRSAIWSPPVPESELELVPRLLIAKYINNEKANYEGWYENGYKSTTSGMQCHSLPPFLRGKRHHRTRKAEVEIQVGPSRKYRSR